MERGPEDITRLLAEVGAGEARAVDALLPLVYEELRSLAQDMLRGERQGHTLQPTALVHEAYLKLVGQTRVEWRNRAHFFAVAGQAIRRILVDHARTRKRTKRGADRQRVVLSDDLVSAFDRSVDLLALDECLAELGDSHPELAQMVEMRFFAGLTIEETAGVLGTSTSTVERDWRFTRAKLHEKLVDSTASGAGDDDRPHTTH